MDGFLVLIFLLCLGFSFLMAGMEAGVFALSRLRIRQQVRAGNHRAHVLYNYLERPEDFLWTILIGNTVANVTLVTLGFLALRAWLGKWPVLFIIALLAGVVLFFA